MHKNLLESDRYPEIVFTPDHIEEAWRWRGNQKGKCMACSEFTAPSTKSRCHFRSADAGQVTATLQFRVPFVKWGMKNPSAFLLKETTR